MSEMKHAPVDWDEVGPELLAALRDMVTLTERLSKEVNWGNSAIQEQTFQLLNEAPWFSRAAIAKAEGKEDA